MNVLDMTQDNQMARLQFLSFGNVEYRFIASTLSFPLSQRGSTFQSLIYRSNRTVQSFTRDYYWYWKELLVLDSNTWNHLTVCKQMINIKKNYLCWIAILKTTKMYANNSNSWNHLTVCE